MPENLLWILESPSNTVVKHDRHKTNRLPLNTKVVYEKRVTQSNGVSIIAKTPQGVSAKIVILFMQT